MQEDIAFDVNGVTISEFKAADVERAFHAIRNLICNEGRHKT